MSLYVDIPFPFTHMGQGCPTICGYREDHEQDRDDDDVETHTIVLEKLTLTCPLDLFDSQEVKHFEEGHKFERVCIENYTEITPIGMRMHIKFDFWDGEDGGTITLDELLNQQRSTKAADF